MMRRNRLHNIYLFLFFIAPIFGSTSCGGETDPPGKVKPLKSKNKTDKEEKAKGKRSKFEKCVYFLYWLFEGEKEGEDSKWRYGETYVDRDFPKLNIEKVVYYLEDGIVDQMQEKHKQLENLDEILPNAARQAAEIWMSESISPPFVYGGVITKEKFESKRARTDVLRVLIRYDESCAKNTSGKECVKNRVAETSVYAVLNSKKNHIPITEEQQFKKVITLFGEIDATAVKIIKDKNKDKEVIFSLKTKTPWITTVDEGYSTERTFTYDPEDSSGKKQKKTMKDNLKKYSLRGVLLHEFGHALGLAHTMEEPHMSVMDENATEPMLSHLYTRDKACLRAIHRGREAIQRGQTVTWTGFRPADKAFLGNPGTSTEDKYLYTDKGTRLSVNNIGYGYSIPNKDDSKDPEIPIREQFSLLMSETGHTRDYFRLLNVTRKCPKGNTSSCRKLKSYKETEWDEVKTYRPSALNIYLNVSPTFAMWSFLKEYREAFVFHDSGSMIVNENFVAKSMDPPEIKVTYLEKKSDAAVGNRVIEDIKYSTYNKWSGQESPAEVVKTHLPVSVAYDHKSEHFLLSFVNTTRPDSNALDVPVDEGGITVAIRKDTPTSTVWKAEGMLHEQDLRLRDKVKPHPFWQPTFKTLFGVATACVDHFATPTKDEYTCFLAWIDRGMPKERNVLYTWFRVSQTEDKKRYHVSWRGDVYIRDNFYAVGDLSAAYVGGSLILTAKNDNDAAHMTVNLLHKPTSFRRWKQSFYDFGKGVVDAPTLGAQPYRKKRLERADTPLVDGYLLWTEREKAETEKVD